MLILDIVVGVASNRADATLVGQAHATVQPVVAHCEQIIVVAANIGA